MPCFLRYATTCLMVFALVGRETRAGQPGETMGWLPPDAAATFRIDFKGLWRGPLMAGFRQTMQRGGGAYALLQLQMSPRLDEIDEITGGIWLGQDGMPQYLIAISTTGALNGKKTAQLLLGQEVQPQPVANATLWAGETLAMAEIAGGGLGGEMLLGELPAVREALGRKKRPVKPGKLLEGQLAIRVEAVGPLAALAQAVPDPYGPAAKAQAIHLNMATGETRLTTSLRVTYASEDEARDALKAIDLAKTLGKASLEQGRTELLRTINRRPPPPLLEHFGSLAALGYLNLTAKEADPVILRDGAELSYTLAVDNSQISSQVVPVVALGVGAMVPAVFTAREAARQTSASNNLKQIALALHNYHDSYGGFLPPAYVVDKAGKPLYSWRVLILPYMEENDIYKQWKMDEAWDGPNNRKLSELVVKVYQSDPAAPPSNKTNYRGFVGEKAGWAPGPKGWLNQGPIQGARRIPDSFPDGTSNTFIVVEARESVPWAAPDAFPYDPAKPLPDLGLAGKPLFLAAMMDGSVRSFKQTLPENIRRLYIERNDGLPIPESRD